jgi:hypothetical protein
VSIEKFTEITEQLLRLALKKMIQRHGVLPNWSELIFG